MAPDRLAELLEKALGALADIARAEDMTAGQRRRKAARVYNEIRAEMDDEFGPDDEIPIPPVGG